MPNKFHILPTFDQLSAVHRGVHPCLGCDTDAQYFDRETKEYFCVLCANEAWLDHQLIDSLNDIILGEWKKLLFTPEEIESLDRRAEP